MRIVVHPLFIFDIFMVNTELARYTSEKMLEVMKDSIYLWMPIYCLTNLTVEQKKQYDYYDNKFNQVCRVKLDYPTDDRWVYPDKMDEMLLALSSGEEIVFCGGYMENCLPRAYGAFKRDYGTYCESNHNLIRLDEDHSFCASETCAERRYLLLDTF